MSCRTHCWLPCGDHFARSVLAVDRWFCGRQCRMPLCRQRGQRPDRRWSKARRFLRDRGEGGSSARFPNNSRISVNDDLKPVTKSAETVPATLDVYVTSVLSRGPGFASQLGLVTPVLRHSRVSSPSFVTQSIALREGTRGASKEQMSAAHPRAVRGHCLNAGAGKPPDKAAPAAHRVSAASAPQAPRKRPPQSRARRHSASETSAGF